MLSVVFQNLISKISKSLMGFIPGTGTNCAFVLCAFATLHLCVLDLTRSRKGAETRRVALNSGYRSTGTYAKKLNLWRCEVVTATRWYTKTQLSPTTHGASSSHFQSGMNTILLPSISSSLSMSSVMISPSTSPNSSNASTSALTSRFSVSSFME